MGLDLQKKALLPGFFHFLFQSSESAVHSRCLWLLLRFFDWEGVIEAQLGASMARAHSSAMGLLRRAAMPRKGRLLCADACPFPGSGIYPCGSPGATWRVMLAANLPLPKRPQSQSAGAGRAGRAEPELRPCQINPDAACRQYKPQ